MSRADALRTTRARAAAEVPVDGLAAPTGATSRPRRTLFAQLLLFASFGFVFNVLYGGLYLLLRSAWDPMWANTAALVATTVGSTAANRRFTFGVRGRSRAGRHQALGLVLLVIGLAVTSSSLGLLYLASPSPTRLSELAVLAAANLVVGLIRFASFRTWMRPGPT